jgi:hypothetical protein
MATSGDGERLCPIKDGSWPTPGTGDRSGGDGVQAASAGTIADLWEWQPRGSCREVDPAVSFHPDGERGAARALER